MSPEELAELIRKSARVRDTAGWKLGITSVHVRDGQVLIVVQNRSNR